MTLLGAIMVIVSPFFDWIHLSVRMNQDRVSDGKSLFGIMIEGIKYLKFGFKTYKILTIFIFLFIILIGLSMLYLGCVDTIWRKETLLPSSMWGGRIDDFLIGYNYANRIQKIILHALPIFISLVVFIIMKKSVMYKEIWTDLHNVLVTWKDMIDMLSASRGVKSGTYRLGNGFGVFLLFFGNALFLLSYFVRYVLDTLNEDDFKLGKAE